MVRLLLVKKVEDYVLEEKVQRKLVQVEELTRDCNKSFYFLFLFNIVFFKTIILLNKTETEISDG
jgi:hypothetical protein